jgi:hypothetical protein
MFGKRRRRREAQERVRAHFAAQAEPQRLLAELAAGDFTHLHCEGESS